MFPPQHLISIETEDRGPSARLDTLCDGAPIVVASVDAYQCRISRVDIWKTGHRRTKESRKQIPYDATVVPLPADGLARPVIPVVAGFRWSVGRVAVGFVALFIASSCGPVSSSPSPLVLGYVAPENFSFCSSKSSVAAVAALEPSHLAVSLKAS